MGSILTAAFWLLSGLVGLWSAQLLLWRERLTVRVALGLSFGLFLQIWLPALFAFGLGFNRVAVFCAAAICVPLMFLLALWQRAHQNGTARNSTAFVHAHEIAPPAENASEPAPSGAWTAHARTARAWLAREAWMLCSVGALFLLSVCLLQTHVLLPDTEGALWCGQSTFGDLPMHLSFIQNLAVSGEFPPNYPLLLGEVPMGYPFLCESPSALWLLEGVSLRTAYLLPVWQALLCVFGCAFAFCEAVLKSAKRATLAFVLFFLGSGFGILYFLDGAAETPEVFLRMFTAFYETPTNLRAENILWVNPIADLLLPQRATLFGWAIAFPCLFLLQRAAFDRQFALFLPLGVLAGGLVLIQTHSFLVLAVLSAPLLLRELLRRPICHRAVHGFLLYAGLALALSLPQLLGFTFAQAAGEGFLRIQFNWANEGDGYFWFYIKNLGLPYLLLLPAFFHAGKTLRWWYAGGLGLLLLAEFVVFQPNAYDNNKLLYFWQFLGLLLVANLLCDVYQKIRARPVRLYAAVLVVGVCTIGSLLTLGREWVSRYQLFSAPEVQAASYVRDHAPPKARFLTADNHNNAVASLTGRPIVCGSASYLYFHGVQDSEARALMEQMFCAPEAELFRKAGVSYVYIGSYERAAFPLDEAYFSENCKLWFANEEVQIYQIQDAFS